MAQERFTAEILDKGDSMEEAYFGIPYSLSLKANNSMHIKWAIHFPAVLLVLVKLVLLFVALISSVKHYLLLGALKIHTTLSTWDHGSNIYDLSF